MPVRARCRANVYGTRAGVNNAGAVAEGQETDKAAEDQFTWFDGVEDILQSGGYILSWESVFIVWVLDCLVFGLLVLSGELLVYSSQ